MKARLLFKIGVVALALLLALVLPASASAQGGQAATLVQNCAVWARQPSGTGPTPIISGLILRKGESVSVTGVAGSNLQVTTRGVTGWIPGKCVGWVPTQPTATPQPAAPPSSVPSQGGIVPLPQGSTANAAVGSQQGIGVLDESCCLRPTTTGGSGAQCLARLAQGAQVAITGYAGEGTCDEGVCSWVDATDPVSKKSGKLHLSCLEGWQSLVEQAGGQAGGQVPGQVPSEEERFGFLMPSGEEVDFIEPEDWPPEKERWDLGQGVSLVNWSELPWPGFKPSNYNPQAIRAMVPSDTTTPIEIGFIDGGAFGAAYISRETAKRLLGGEQLVQAFERFNGLRHPKGVHRIYFTTDDVAPRIDEEIVPLLAQNDINLFLNQLIAHELTTLEWFISGKNLPILRTIAEYGATGAVKLPQQVRDQIKAQFNEHERGVWQAALSNPKLVASLVTNHEFLHPEVWSSSSCVGPKCPREPGGSGQPGSTKQQP